MYRVAEIARMVALNSLAIGGLGLFVAASVQLSREGDVARIEAPKVPDFVREVALSQLVGSARVGSRENLLPDRAPSLEPERGQVPASAERGEQAVGNPAGRALEAVVAEVKKDPRPVVVLDPGHGGRDGGTIAGGALEKRLNLDAAQRVAKRLRKAGVRVVWTRADDSYVSLGGRAKMANLFPGALFVSIHHNASTNSGPSGFETYYTSAKSGPAEAVQHRRFGAKVGEVFVDRRGALLAKEIQEAFALATGAVNRGIKDRSLVVTRMVSCPAVLVECGFLSNASERKNLQSESYRDKMSAGIAGGVMRYLNHVEGEPRYGVGVE